MASTNRSSPRQDFVISLAIVEDVREAYISDASLRLALPVPIIQQGHRYEFIGEDCRWLEPTAAQTAAWPGFMWRVDSFEGLEHRLWWVTCRALVAREPLPGWLSFGPRGHFVDVLLHNLAQLDRDTVERLGKVRVQRAGPAPKVSPVAEPEAGDLGPAMNNARLSLGSVLIARAEEIAPDAVDLFEPHYAEWRSEAWNEARQALFQLADALVRGEAALPPPFDEAIWADELLTDWNERDLPAALWPATDGPPSRTPGKLYDPGDRPSPSAPLEALRVRLRRQIGDMLYLVDVIGANGWQLLANEVDAIRGIGEVERELAGYSASGQKHPEDARRRASEAVIHGAAAIRSAHQIVATFVRSSVSDADPSGQSN
jgi:hypothetical protein